VAIIVNKEEKRHNIAFACKELLLEHGIEEISISQIAKTAGVGKGTIYEYFDNKEDIVFEIITTFIWEHEKKLLEIRDLKISIREKLFHFLYLLFENETARKHLHIYKEFLAISLMKENQEMLDFSESCREKFISILTQIIQSGISSGELNERMIQFSSNVVMFGTGLVVDSRIPGCDVNREINIFLDMFLQEGSEAV